MHIQPKAFHLTRYQCTGGEPCLQCQKKKRGKNRETCWYDPKHDPANRVRKAGLKKSKRSTSQGNVECGIGADDEVSSSEESASNGLGTGCPSADDDLGPYGMYRCISQVSCFHAVRSWMLMLSVPGNVWCCDPPILFGCR